MKECGIDPTKDLQTSFKITGRIAGGIFEASKPHIKRYVGKKIQKVLSSDKIRFKA